MESVYMTKQFNDHFIHLIVEESESGWNAIARCDDCQEHVHFGAMNFTSVDALFLIETEFKMHSAGQELGWHDGPGFKMQGE